MILPNTVTKYLPVVGIAVCAFLAGRYTTKDSVTKELDTKYHEQLAQFEQTSKQEYEQKLAVETEKTKMDYEAKISKITDSKKTTVIDKDGNTTITEETKTKENTEEKETKTDDKTSNKTDTKDVVSNDTKTETKDISKETKEITKITPPPAIRIYAMMLLDDVVHQRDPMYGSGAMYDLGFLNVGTVGLFSPTTSKTSVGFTLGISF